MPVPLKQKNLSYIQQHMLARIILLLKLMKIQNRFIQSWCKGQLVLFAQDVVGVAEQLLLCNVRLAIITESHKNLQQQRKFQVNIERLRIGLPWLLKHNILYLDARPNFANVLNYNISEIAQVIFVENMEYRDDMQMPVSYTHLDVYKRQVCVCVCARAHACILYCYVMDEHR